MPTLVVSATTLLVSCVVFGKGLERRGERPGRQQTRQIHPFSTVLRAGFTYFSLLLALTSVWWSTEMS